jgi:hypothetical protein
MTTYETWSIVFSGGALAVAAIAVIWSIINRGDSKRSADASVASAAEARRSADIAERSFSLGLKPAVVVRMGRKQIQSAFRRAGKEVNALNLESKGPGIAFDTRAELQVCPEGSESPLVLDTPLLILRPGESYEVAPVPRDGKLEVWGKVVYTDADRRTYCIKKARGEGDWHPVEQPE